MAAFAPWTDDPEAAGLSQQPMTGRRRLTTSSKRSARITSGSASIWWVVVAPSRKMPEAIPT